MALRILKKEPTETEQQHIHNALSPAHEPAADGEWVTEGGMHVARYAAAIENVPVDFFGDPDGSWTYEALVEAAGFAASDGVAIGVLREPFGQHPEGAAVVTLDAAARPYIAIIECPIAYAIVEADAEREISAA
jgi:hypothetical protein